MRFGLAGAALPRFATGFAARTGFFAAALGGCLALVGFFTVAPPFPTGFGFLDAGLGLGLADALRGPAFAFGFAGTAFLFRAGLRTGFLGAVFFF
jgi:hypothetical protein